MKDERTRYFIAIVPPRDLSSKIRQWQQELAEKYGTKASLRSPPHITLHMPFLWKDTREAELIEGLSNHLRTTPAFMICLEGFGAFPPRVIYVNVKSTADLISCQKELTRFCKVNFDLHNSTYGEEPYHPHITLAFRDLRKSDFSKAWDEFSIKDLRVEFQAESITLLKHTGKEWVGHRELKLG